MAKSSTMNNFQTLYTEVMEIRKVFGENVRVLREAMNWSAEFLGEKVGCTGKHLYDIEKGRKNASMDLIESLSRELGANTADLFKVDMPKPLILPMSVAISRISKVPNGVWDMVDEIDTEGWNDVESLMRGYIKSKKGKEARA